MPAVGVCFALGVAAVIACDDRDNSEDDNQFRDDVIWCEEAVARLVRCCPNFDAQKIECRFFYSHETGCSTSTTRLTEPAFSKDESRCVRDTSCEAIVANKVCARAEAAAAARTTETTTDNNSTSSGTSGTTSSSGSGTPSTTTTEPPPRDRVCP